MRTSAATEIEEEGTEKMIKVCSLSGGRTSAYLAHTLRSQDPETKFIFMDTGAEHPATYQFVRDIVCHWGIDVTFLRMVPLDFGKGCYYEVVGIDDIGPNLIAWERMLQKYGHPYVGGAFCTDRMKTRPFQKYCDDTYGKGNYETWLGIRADEPKRLKAKDGIRYLAEISDFEKPDVLAWWRAQPFDLGIPEHLGNCVFCIKKSLMKVALATKDEPGLCRQFIDSVNKHDKKPDKAMYRNKASLEQVIAMFSDISRDDLASRMLSMRQYDTGSCSESCEAFSDE